MASTSLCLAMLYSLLLHFITAKVLALSCVRLLLRFKSYTATGSSGEDGKEGSPKQQVDQNLSSTEQLDPPKHAPKRVTIPNPGGKSVATPWTRSSLDTIVLQSKVGLHKTGVGRCEDYISSYLTAATACLELDSEQEFSDFRNGGICILPGEEPPLTNQQASFGQRLGELLLNEGAAAGLTALIEKIKGKPTKEQANSVENFALAAASGARRSLAVELGPSIVEREAGNSIYCSLLGTIADRLQLKDTEFPIICQRGLPLGIDVAIPYTNLYPRFKPKKQEEFETPEIHTNYKSMMLPEVREKADKIVRDEEDKGYIQRLGETDLHNEARTFIRRAAVPKAGSFENGVRIVEDFKRSNTNLHSTIPNTARLPSVSHLRQLISSLADATSQSTAKYRILQFDLKSAYRHLGIHPSERKNVSFTHTFLDGNTVAYENKVLSFGHSGAAYWFVRYANLALSCLELILRATFSVSISKPFGSYMYVDDGFLCIWVEIYAQVATVIIVFWLLLGSGLSCDKLRFNLTEGTVVGIRIDIRDSPCFEIDPAKTEKLLADLRALVSSECISEQKLASLAGKLNRYASLRKYLKPYLQPFYGLLAVMRKLGRPAAACPRKSEVNITASFFIDILSDPHAFHSVGPIQRSLDGYAGTMLLFTDASTRALGGVIALRGSPTACPIESLSSRPTIWFHKEIDESILKPWALASKDRRVGTVAKDIVIAELLAVCLALKEAERTFGSLSDYKVAIYTDNKAVVSILRSMYSKTPVLAQLLRRVVRSLARLTLTSCTVQWLSSEDNWVADRISRGDTAFLPTSWRKVNVDDGSLPAMTPYRSK